METDRARLTLNLASGAQRQVLVNLVRLREAVELSGPESGTDFLPDAAPQEVGVATPSEIEAPELQEADPPAEDVAIAIDDPVEALPERDTPQTGEEEPVLPTLDDAPAAEAIPSSESVDAVTPTIPDPEQVTQDATPTVIPEAPTSADDPDPSAVTCTFFCAAIDNIEATYPMSQAIALGEDEPLESLEARLEQVHAQICSDSGGQLVVESLPNCTAQ